MHEAGAEDGGDAEDDEQGADVHGALPRLLVDICWSVGVRLPCTCTGRGWGGVLSLSKRDYGAVMA